MKTARIEITGMSCGHCVDAVETALRSRAGVRAAKVDLTAGTAEVEYEEREVGPEDLIAAVTNEGYAATFAESGAGPR
jgi:copper chaperone